MTNHELATKIFRAKDMAAVCVMTSLIAAAAVLLHPLVWALWLLLAFNYWWKTVKLERHRLNWEQKNREFLIQAANRSRQLGTPKRYHYQRPDGTHRD